MYKKQKKGAVYMKTFKIYCVTFFILFSSQQMYDSEAPVEGTETTQPQNNYLQIIKDKFLAAQMYVFSKQQKEKLAAKKQEIPIEQSIITPELIYDVGRKLLTQQSPIANTVDNVNTYFLSPQKKYVLINKTTKASAFTGIMPNFISSLLFQRNITQLINTQTNEIISTFNFEKDMMMYAFDPKEERLLIAGLKKPLGAKIGFTKPSTLHESSKKDRIALETGEILQYEVFDIASQSVIKTVENVQAIQFDEQGKLITQYDDEVIEQTTFTRGTSLLGKLMGNVIGNYYSQKITVTDETIKNNLPLIGTRYLYDNFSKQLIFTPSHGKESRSIKIINDADFYYVSPQKKFISINSPTQGPVANVIAMVKQETIDTTFYNAESGKQMPTCTSVFTYAYNPDETRLIVASRETDILTAAKVKYELFDTTTIPFELITTFNDVQSAYFDRLNKIIIIDKDGKKSAIEDLSKEEREKRKKSFSSIAAVQKGGWEAVKSAATETRQALVSGIKEFLQPSPQPEEKGQEREQKVIAKEPPTKEDQTKIINRELKKIADTLKQENDFNTKEQAMQQYNAYDISTRKKFIPLFFSSAESFENSKTFSVNAQDGQNLYITNKTTKPKPSTTSLELKDIATVVVFNSKEFFAIGYEDSTIDIFAPSNGTLEYKKTITTNKPIVNLRFVDTTDNVSYLFYVGTDYMMGMITI
jgi:hypothetical protein